MKPPVDDNSHRLTNIYAKNYCNRTLIVKVIVENVVTCLLRNLSFFVFCDFPR